MDIRPSRDSAIVHVGCDPGHPTIIPMQVHEANPPDPLRIVIVDADDLVRESLTGLLGIGRLVTVVGTASGADQALRLVQALQPDVVVVDPRLPELSAGLDFIQRAKALAPGSAVLVIGSADVVEHVAVGGGVDGCVRKTFRPDDLTAAILAAGRRAPD
jgi:DNA-binding NarL/FixJ family response regulator